MVLNLLKDKNRRNQSDVIDVVLVSFLLTLNICHTFFSVSVVGFELVNVCWAVLQLI